MMIKNNKILKPLLSSIFICVLLFSFTVNVLAENKTEEPITPPPQKVAISFNTMGGSEVDAIYGYAGETQITEDMLPTPTKEGYIFKGWRHFNEYGMPFELTVFPNYDITLVADFDPLGFEVTFEAAISEVYDINSAIELYAPGTKKYSHDKVKEGWRSLVTKKSRDTAPMFLLSYHNALEVGKEYEFRVNIKSERLGAKGSVDFLYTENPDVRDKAIGVYNAFDLEKSKKGEWKEYKVKFVAAAPYIIVKLPNINGLYIDDINIQKTGVAGEIPKLENVAGETPVNLTVFIVIAIIISAIAVIVIICFKNRKKG